MMGEESDLEDFTIDCHGAWMRPRTQSNVTVLQIGGEVDFGNADEIHRHASRYAAVAVALVVDTTAVEFLSVKGLRALIALGDQCHDVGIEWALVGSGSVHRLLRISEGRRTLPLADSVSAALQRITMASVGYGSGG